MWLFSVENFLVAKRGTASNVARSTHRPDGNPQSLEIHEGFQTKIVFMKEEMAISLLFPFLINFM
jgi:hypothetical protein